MALLTKIKTRLAIHARRPVSSLLEGQYASMLAGRSLDFADLREYIAGDDVSDIDWNASARHGGLLVKRYVADRKHTVFLVVDTGREFAGLASWSGDDGTTKRDLAITVAGVIGWLAVSHGDYVGLVCTAADGPTITRPSTREVELERMLGLVQASSTAESAHQDTATLLDYATATVRRRTIMFLVLGDVEIDRTTEDALRRLLVQHEVVVVTLGDLDPTEPGRVGRTVHDIGTGRRFPRFAAESVALATEIASADAARAERRRAVLTRLSISHAHLDHPDRVIPDLLQLIGGMRRVR